MCHGIFGKDNTLNTGISVYNTLTSQLRSCHSLRTEQTVYANRIRKRTNESTFIHAHSLNRLAVNSVNKILALNELIREFEQN